MSDSSVSDGPVICVPLKDILGMTDAQIGASARKAVWTANLAAACALAHNIVFENKFVSKRSDLLRRFEWKDLDILYRFIGDDEVIDRAIDILTPAVTERARLEEAAKAKKAKRSEIAASYNKIFVTLGRRDGFVCAICGEAGGDLQIDHVIPLSKDGSNDMSNLQLLCKTCNIAKGAD